MTTNNICNDYNVINRIVEIRSFPSLCLSSPITNIPRLTSLDGDLHMPIENNFSYYTIKDFKECCDIKECALSRKAFTAVHCNIRSLAANHDNLCHLLNEMNLPFSIIALSETKILKNNTSITNTSLEGYEFIHEPSLSNAGGVGFYIRNDLKYSIRKEFSLSNNDLEMLWIEIFAIGQPNIICGVVYRHPNNNVNNFINILESTLENIQYENKLCLFMGDVNIDLMKIETHAESENFINMLSSYFFQPQILQPTRITHHSATLIDNIFFNSLEHHIISGNIIYDLTDHLPNFVIINNFSDLSPAVSIYKRDYSHLDENNLIEEVNQINWHKIYSNVSDPTTMFTSFYDKLNQIIDKHLPFKKLSRKEIKFSSKPWITKGIKTSINLKNKLYKKYLKTKHSYYLCKFKYYRNRINHLLKISKKVYYSNYFQQHIKNGKKVWNGIRQIVQYKAKNTRTINKIKDDDIEITDPKEIANAFNKYFASVGCNLAEMIDRVDSNPTEYLKTPVTKSFIIAPVTMSEVEREISALKNDKATGPYSIPVKILKLLKTVISKPLATLFNVSFSLGIVPSSLKTANIIPIHKKDCRLTLSNYRPISLLSVFNKLLEKLMANRLVKFLEDNNIFYKNQFGFRNYHSTDYAILTIIDKIQSAIDASDYSCGIFLDCSKAFDTINHQILIQKLDFYGIRGIEKKWFISYLSNRRQSVIINNVSSDLTSVSCGIPQGSVLGPILFLIYINDFHLCSSLFDFHLFADDANLFYRHRNLDTLKENINSELNNIHSWLCANKLSLNIEKSNFVLFHSRQKKVSTDFELTLNNKRLKQESSIKYLGIYIDSFLSWKTHVVYISKKIKRNIGILCKLRYYVQTDILVNLYYALIYPFLTYGLLAWGNTYKTTLQPIVILQKKTIRLLTFSSFDAHSSPLFKLLSILKMNDLVEYYVAIFMFKYNNNLLPSVFNNFFNSVSNIHKYRTRSATKNNFHIPKANTNYGKFNIRFQGAKIWNAIDENIRKTETLKKFKHNLKVTVLKSY